MRVAIVTESFLPALNGVTTSVCRVVKHLRREGHDVLIIAPRLRVNRQSNEGLASTWHGAHVHRVSSVPVRGFDVGLPSAQVERALANFRPDVVHIASPFAIGARGLHAAHRLGLPSVAIFQTDMAGYIAHTAQNVAGRVVAEAAWRWIRKIHSYADLTLAPSSAALADLERAEVPRTKLWGRGVDTELFNPMWRDDPRTQALRARLAPNGERLLGYVGRLAPEKELPRMAELADLPGTRLVIVGDGPTRADDSRLLGEAVARAGVTLPPAFLGPKEGEDLARAYAAFDLFVHTGTRETFGQTIQEAGATGLAVVAPRAGGPIDLVRDGQNGYLFDPERPGALREQVERALACDVHLADMGRRGTERVALRSWDAVIGHLVEHYHELAAQRRPAPLRAAA